MANPWFISYSTVDSKEFARQLADQLRAGPPEIPVWLDQRDLRPGQDWDEQIVTALQTCKGLLFVMTPDSVSPNSVCKNEWVRALKYKKPIVPLLNHRDAELPFRLSSRQYIDFTGSPEAALARLRQHLTWIDSPAGQLQALKDRLTDAALRLMVVVGRGGIGKTAMVCRLLRSLEGGKLPDDGGPLPVDGIAYLSNAREFHRATVPDLFTSLAKLLPDAAAARLDAAYKNPRSSTHTKVTALVQAFPQGRTVILLNNLEDAVELATGRIKDGELDEALKALLELPPHGIKVIITTRVAPTELAMVQPALQRRLDLDLGLESPYAENVLRAMDADGKVGLRDASADLLYHFSKVLTDIKILKFKTILSKIQSHH